MGTECGGTGLLPACTGHCVQPWVPWTRVEGWGAGAHVPMCSPETTPPPDSLKPQGPLSPI